MTLARATAHGTGDAALLERDEYGHRVRVAKRARTNALAKESAFEPRASGRGFEAMMRATEHITSDDGDGDGEGDGAAHADTAADAAPRWKRFEPESKTLKRLAEHPSKETGNLTGTHSKKFSFVTAKFVVAPHCMVCAFPPLHNHWRCHRNTPEMANGCLLPLAFCMLASLWLNLPFMPSDFARWAMNGTLPTFHCFQMLPRKSAYKHFFKPTVCTTTATSFFLSFSITWEHVQQGVVKRFDLAVLTEGLAREMSLPFPQLNGPYCLEHIIMFYRLPSL